MDIQKFNQVRPKSQLTNGAPTWFQHNKDVDQGQVAWKPDQDPRDGFVQTSGEGIVSQSILNPDPTKSHSDLTRSEFSDKDGGKKVILDRNSLNKDGDFERLEVRMDNGVPSTHLQTERDGQVLAYESKGPHAKALFQEVEAEFQEKWNLVE